jgi:glyoxylase-like metal-dependent hydrolase (beta-lactamase superfamily II)/rhodanese-related sulfurtransferase
LQLLSVTDFKNKKIKTMKVEQIYTGCLAEAAYYIESNGEVAIIDPLRETTPYIERAEKDNAKIKYVFETHFHADFVSGHIDLAQKTGAKIVYGPTANPNYDVVIAKDEEVFPLGNVKIKVLHTPGHTPESTTFLLIDENGKNYAIFTGDTLFIGDVGRPDLAIKGDLTEKDLAGMLYDSLHNKILPLENDVIVYPGHGAGSACGKKMSKETFATLGHQKEFNYALKAQTKDQFIKEVTTGLAAPPQYFPKNAMMNKMGYESIDKVMEKGSKALSPDMFEEVANAYGAVMLDVRNAEEFAKGFVPNSVNIGLDGQFAPWVGALLTDLKQSILLITPEGREEETVLRLARVGYDNCLGYLDGGFNAWKNAGKEVDTVETVTSEEFSDILNKDKNINVLDVRRKSEYDSEHIIDAQNFPLDYINKNMAEVNRDKKYYIHCAGGYRSMIAASILKARGFENLIDVNGGFNAIRATGKVPMTDYVCPSTLL